jgi:hypothetical protein
VNPICTQEGSKSISSHGRNMKEWDETICPLVIFRRQPQLIHKAIRQCPF